MPSTSEFRKGLKIGFEGKPYIIIGFQHVKPGKGGAFVRTKLKNILTGQILDKTFRSGEVLEEPDIDEKTVEFLFKEGEQYCFMDLSTYEQVFMDASHLKGNAKWLKENMELTLLFYKGEPSDVILPNFVNLSIVETDPGVRGDTVSGGTKSAVLETGAVVQVPLFLSPDDMIRVDTRTGEYVERV